MYSAEQLIEMAAKREGFDDPLDMLASQCGSNDHTIALCRACGETQDQPLEPDSWNARCEDCGVKAATSVLVLAGVI